MREKVLGTLMNRDGVSAGSTGRKDVMEEVTSGDRSVGLCRDGPWRRNPVPSSLVLQCPSERHGHSAGLALIVWAPRQGPPAG